jgi:hypothetical protein
MDAEKQMPMPSKTAQVPRLTGGKAEIHVANASCFLIKGSVHMVIFAAASGATYRGGV